MRRGELGRQSFPHFSTQFLNLVSELRRRDTVRIRNLDHCRPILLLVRGLLHRICCLVFSSKNEKKKKKKKNICACSVGGVVEPCETISEGS